MKRPGLPLAKHKSDNTHVKRESGVLEEEKKAGSGDLEWMSRRLNAPVGGTGKLKKTKTQAVEKAAKQLKDRKERKRSEQEESKTTTNAEQLELFNEIIASRADAGTL